jgi:hypothetical protein
LAIEETDAGGEGIFAAGNGFAAQNNPENEPPIARVDKGWSGGHNEKASLYA